MNINKNILKKEILVELKNSSSLFLITPTMSVLIIIFPILIENRFAVDEDLFIISHLLFLIIFSTLFAIRSKAWDSNSLRILLGINLRNFGFFLNPKVIDLWAVNEFSGFFRGHW